MLKKVGAPPPVPATPIEPEHQKPPESQIIPEKVEQVPAQKQPTQSAPPPPILREVHQF